MIRLAVQLTFSCSSFLSCRLRWLRSCLGSLVLQRSFVSSSLFGGGLREYLPDRHVRDSLHACPLPSSRWCRFLLVRYLHCVQGYQAYSRCYSVRLGGCDMWNLVPLLFCVTISLLSGLFLRAGRSRLPMLPLRRSCSSPLR